MSSKFSRFLHIERAREDKGAADKQASLRDGGRFESVTAPGEASPAPSLPSAHLDRFRPPEPAPLELAEGSAPAHHFSRCLRCETENGRFSRTCTTCGADLDTPEQRAADAQRGHAHDQAEERAREEMRVRQEVHAAPLDGSLHAEPAPTPAWFEPSLGRGLLRRLRGSTARRVGLGAAVGVPLLLLRAGQGPLWVAGVYLGVFVAASFVPSSLWRAQRRDE